MAFHWFLLVWSLLAFISSIWLLKIHQKQNEALDDYTKPSGVSMGEYVLFGTFGWLGISVSPFCILASGYLLVIDYFW